MLHDGVWEARVDLGYTVAPGLTPLANMLPSFLAPGQLPCTTTHRYTVETVEADAAWQPGGFAYISNFLTPADDSRESPHERARLTSTPPLDHTSHTHPATRDEHEHTRILRPSSTLSHAPKLRPGIAHEPETVLIPNKHDQSQASSAKRPLALHNERPNMEFCLPRTGLGVLMPQPDFAPMLDWAHTNPLDSTEANRTRQADDGAPEFEQSIMGQVPPDSPTYLDLCSLDTILEPSGISLDPYRSATPASRHSSSPAATQPAAAPKAGPAKQRRRRGGAGPSTEEARAKNRLAATKCRRKKKVAERGLEERQRRLHRQRAVLRAAAAALAHEVLALKHEVLRHAACGFSPLDRYIAAAAACDSVSPLSSASA